MCNPRWYGERRHQRKKRKWFQVDRIRKNQLIYLRPEMNEYGSNVLFPSNKILHNLRPPFRSTPKSISWHIQNRQSRRPSGSFEPFPRVLASTAFDGEHIHRSCPTRSTTCVSQTSTHDRIQKTRFADIRATQKGYFGQVAAVEIPKSRGGIVQ